MSARQRTAIASLAVSAAAFIALVAHEGYSDKAIIPVPGDVSNWGKRSFNGPSALKPSVDPFGCSSYLFGPLCHCFSLAEAFYKNTVLFVSRLLRVRCPPTIFSGVGAVNVDAVDGATIRLGTHVSKEISKHMPSFADDYAATTISCKKPISWVVAPSEHVAPSFVLFGGPSFIRVGRMSMSVVRRASPVLLQTPARLCVSISQFARINNGIVSAIANTYPRRSNTLVWRLLENLEFVKFLSGKVDKVWHSEVSYG